MSELLSLRTLLALLNSFRLRRGGKHVTWVELNRRMAGIQSVPEAKICTSDLI